VLSLLLLLLLLPLLLLTIAISMPPLLQLLRLLLLRPLWLLLLRLLWLLLLQLLWLLLLWLPSPARLPGLPFGGYTQAVHTRVRDPREGRCCVDDPAAGARACFCMHNDRDVPPLGGR
jgi:signal transduction histidine kinase